MRVRNGITGEGGCLDIEMFGESFDLSENSVGWKRGRRAGEWEIGDRTRYRECVM